MGYSGTSYPTYIETLRRGYIVLTQSHICNVSINTGNYSDIRWLFNYQQTQTQLLLQLVEIFLYNTIGMAENLYFSFYFSIHSVSCNDQHKIFQITKGPLTAGEEHLYTSREPWPSCAKIKSLFDWDFKPFLDKRRGNYSLAPLFSM